MVDFDAGIWSRKPKSKHRRNVFLSGKSGQTTAPAWSENINSSISWTYLSSGGFTGQAFSPFCAWVGICFQRLAAWVSQKAPARDVIWTARGNSIIIAGNASARTTAKPSTTKWFHLVRTEYYLTATGMENSADWNTFYRNFDDNH